MLGWTSWGLARAFRCHATAFCVLVSGEPVASLTRKHFVLVASEDLSLHVTLFQVEFGFVRAVRCSTRHL